MRRPMVHYLSEHSQVVVVFLYFCVLKMDNVGYGKISSRSESPKNIDCYSAIYSRVAFERIKSEGGKLSHRRAIADLEESIDCLKLTSDCQVVQRICELLNKHGQDLEIENKDKMNELFKMLKCVAGSTRVDVKSRLLLLKLFKQRTTGWDKDPKSPVVPEQQDCQRFEETQSQTKCGRDVPPVPSEVSPNAGTVKHILCGSTPETATQMSTVMLTLTKQQAQSLILKGKLALQDLCLSCKVEVTFQQEKKSNSIQATLSGYTSSIDEAKRKLFLLIKDDTYHEPAAVNPFKHDTETIQPQSPVEGRNFITGAENTTVPDLRITKNEDDWNIQVENKIVPGFSLGRGRWRRTLGPKRTTEFSPGYTDSNDQQPDNNDDIKDDQQAIDKISDSNQKMYTKEFLLSCWHSCTSQSPPADMYTVDDHEMFVIEMRWEPNPFDILKPKDIWRDTGSFGQSRRISAEDNLL